MVEGGANDVGVPGGSDQASDWGDLDLIARQLTEVSARTARGVVRMRAPNAADFVGRLLEMASELPLVIAQGQRASAAAAVHEVRELLQTKDDFVHMATHELRRPVTVVRGYVSMLEAGTYGELPERIREAIRQIGVGGEHMAMLLEQLATTARLEDRAEALRLAPCHLGQIVAEAVAVVEPEGTAKGIRIELRLSSPDPELEVDADRLRIAVVNLLSNAVKYGPQSSTVTIATCQVEREAIITVTDQGPGIEPGEAGSLFGKWARGAGSDSSGLGLGLYIARRLVELHGGKVTVDSIPGQGATFAIVLNLRHP